MNHEFPTFKDILKETIWYSGTLESSKEGDPSLSFNKKRGEKYTTLTLEGDLNQDQNKAYVKSLTVSLKDTHIKTVNEFRGTIDNPNFKVSYMFGGICFDDTICKKVCQPLGNKIRCFELISKINKPGEKYMDVFNYINGEEFPDLGNNVILLKNNDPPQKPESIPSLVDNTVFKEIQPYIKEEKKYTDAVTPTSFISEGNNVVLPGLYYRGWFISSEGAKHYFAIKMVEDDYKHRFEKIYVDNIQFSGK